MSPRKVRAVAALIRNKWVFEAEDLLRNANKRAATPVLKLLNSAVANATNNSKMVHDKLFVKEIFINGGPIFSRYMPRARGSAYEIQKKTSHVTIILAEKEGAVKRAAFAASKAVASRGAGLKTETAHESGSKKTDKSFSPKTEKISPKKNFTGIGKRIFKRKAI